MTTEEKIIKNKLGLLRDRPVLPLRRGRRYPSRPLRQHLPAPRVRHILRPHPTTPHLWTPSPM